MLPPRDQRSKENYCNAIGCGIRSGPRPANRRSARAARDKFRTPRDSATEYAKKLLHARRDAHPSPFAAEARSDNPAPVGWATPCLPFHRVPRWQSAGWPAGSRASPRAEKLGEYVRYGRVATILRWRSLGSNLFLLLSSATRAARYNSGGPAEPASGRENPPSRDLRCPRRARSTSRRRPAAPAPAR